MSREVPTWDSNMSGLDGARVNKFEHDWGFPCDLWLTNGITSSGHLETEWQTEMIENVTFPHSDESGNNTNVETCRWKKSSNNEGF